MLRVWTLVLLAAAALLVPLAAPADDWAQFGKDEKHSRASTDRLPLPLTDLWLVPGGKPGTFWRGRYYYVATHSFLRWLVCVDARTGLQLWQQALEGLPETPGVEFGPLPPVPTVSTEGLVYVHDWARQPHRIAHVVVRDAERQRGEFVYTEHRHHLLRLFDGLTGRAVGTYPPPVLEEEPAARVYLADGLSPFVPTAADRAALWQPLGSFALSGNTLHTVDSSHNAVVWRPGERAGYIPVYHALPNHPEGGIPVLFTCYPLTLAGSGMFVSGWARLSDVEGRRVYAVLKGSAAAWHLDLPYIPGIASSNGGTLFVPMQGSRGSQIGALDAGSGLTRWQFPPEGVPPIVSRVTGSASGGGVVNGRPFAFSRSGTSLRDGAWTHTTHALTLARERVYGELNGTIIALRQENGLPVWRHALGRHGSAGSMLATAEHLLAIVDHPDTRGSELVAFDLETGRIKHRQPMRVGGDLAASEHLLFLHTPQEGMRALAPAERTFRVAVDSPQLEHYRVETPEDTPEPEGKEEGAAVQPPANGQEPPGDGEERPGKGEEPRGAGEQRPAEKKGSPEAPLVQEDVAGLPRQSPALADATILRLNWSSPLAELVRKARERRTLCPTLPLVLSLDWLDASRSRIEGAAQGATPPRAEFARACGELARAVNPDYFDVAPEVNVYLARDPRRLEEVRELVREAARAVKSASSNTRTVLSLNAEVLTRTYGRGGEPSFGKLILPDPRDTGAALTLCAEVDAVGLTSHPRSAFKLPQLIPYDYFLRLKAQIRKPVLLTRLSVRVSRQARDPLGDQRRFLRRLIQTSYWLNARVVAYPDVGCREGAADDALLGNPERPALYAWRDLLGWKRVERLTADPGDHPLITVEPG